MTAMSMGRLLVPALSVLLGCASSNAHAGLSNAPSEERPWDDRDRSEDVIANGPGSCPPSGRREDDPLKYRRPRCAELSPPKPAGSNVVPVSAPSSSAR